MIKNKDWLIKSYYGSRSRCDIWMKIYRIKILEMVVGIGLFLGKYEDLGKVLDIIVGMFIMGFLREVGIVGILWVWGWLVSLILGYI